MTQNIHIGSRLSYNGDLCTVRYIGKIGHWDGMAYGVEWDNPNKGKHNGNLDGFQYFSCKVPGTGSFLKTIRKQDQSVDFLDALRNKYQLDFPSNSVIKIGASKTIETFCTKKLIQKMSQLDLLYTVTLDHQKIHDQVMSLSEIKPHIKLTNLSNLGLGYNLLSSVDSVLNICDSLCSLKTLVLNGNRFTITSIKSQSCPQLKTLSLADTLIEPEALLIWATAFPNISELSLAHNKFTRPFDLSMFCNLLSLDLSNNKLKELPASGLLPSSVKKLSISNNLIETIEGSSLTIFDLDLSQNMITKWESFDKLGQLYPFISCLRLNNNSFCNLNDQLIICLARWSGKKTLEKFNGVSITEKEITDAEIYFIHQVIEKKMMYDSESTHWKRLMRKHTEILYSPSLKLEGGMNKKILILNIVGDNTQKKIKVLKSDTIQKIKGIAAKIFKENPLEVTLSYFDKDLKEYFQINDIYNTIDFYGFENESLVYLKKKKNLELN